MVLPDINEPDQLRPRVEHLRSYLETRLGKNSLERLYHAVDSSSASLGGDDNEIAKVIEDALPSSGAAYQKLLTRLVECQRRLNFISRSSLHMN